MDGTQRERILSAARALGPSRFNQLVQSVDEVRRRQRLRHWQEELIAQLPGIEQPPIVTANEFVSIFGGAETLEVPPRVISREEFFAQPNYWYYLGDAVIPDGWVAAAWESIPEFRNNVSYEFVREARKNGELDCLESSLKFLAEILPLQRMIELYEEVRSQSPNREPEFRPTFVKVFGDRMSEFPAPLTTDSASPRLESHRFPAESCRETDDDDIPF